MSEQTPSFRERLAAGEVVVGTWSVIPSSWVTEVLAMAGLDFIIVDMEHGPSGFDVAAEMIRAAQLHGCAPLVRVPSLDESAILRALDLGPAGVVIPQVQSSEDVRRVIEYSKYPPIGQRGHSPFTRSGGFTHRDAAAAIERSNSRTTVGILVEGRQGLDALDEILEAGIGTVDFVYIGLYDLAKSLGYPGDIEHPAVIDEMAMCVQRTNDAGMVAGTITNSANAIMELVSIGVRFLAYQNDTGILFNAVKSVVESVRQ